MEQDLLLSKYWERHHCCLCLSSLLTFPGYSMAWKIKQDIHHPVKLYIWHFFCYSIHQVLTHGLSIALLGSWTGHLSRLNSLFSACLWLSFKSAFSFFQGNDWHFMKAFFEYESVTQDSCFSISDWDFFLNRHNTNALRISKRPQGIIQLTTHLNSHRHSIFFFTTTGSFECLI